MHRMISSRLSSRLPIYGLPTTGCGLFPEIEISHPLHENWFIWWSGFEDEIPPQDCYTVTTIWIFAVVIKMEAMKSRNDFD
jgi:hypothetical protein